MGCRWCAGPTKGGALYCSATHKSRAKEKRGQIAAGKCRFPSLATHLSHAAAESAAKPGERAVHCLNGCHGWHLTAACPTPDKTAYPSSFEARQAQRGAQKVIAETGLIPPSRLRSLEHALRCLSRDARTVATNHPDGPKSHAAAALRGKSGAYMEAAIMVRHIANGHALHPRAYSTERRLSRSFAARREARRARRDDSA